MSRITCHNQFLSLPPSRRNVLLLLLALFLGSFAALAQQQDKGVIEGRVTDPSGAVIADADITIVNTGTNVTFNLKTNAEGVYTSPPLQIGTYSVTALKNGFSEILEPGVVIDVDSRSKIDFAMKPGSVNSEITVQSESPALNTSSGTIGMVIDQNTLNDLPLNGGNALALAALLPGVTNAFGATTSGFNDRGTQLSAIRVGGGAIGANANSLDGANNQLTYLGEVAINPQADSIAQFRLITGAASAQFGFTSGGIIDIASRAGGNQLHGTVYEFLRNDAFDARNYFANTGLHKPELRYNRFGGSIGGAFIKNKLFYFANSELYELVSTTPALATVPTDLERMGDFSQSVVWTIVAGVPTPSPVRVFNPTTGMEYSGEKLTNMDPAALAIQNNFYPRANRPFDQFTSVNNFAGSTKLKSSQKLILGRIDYQISPRNGIFGRYAYYENQTNNAGIFPNPVASTRNDDPINQNLTLGYTRVVSPNSINDLRLSVIRADFPFRSGSFGQNWPAKLGISNIPPDTLPSLGITGIATFNTVEGFRASTQFQITDNLTRQIGQHATSVGIDLRLSQAYNGQNNTPSGTFNFLSNTTAPSGTSTPGSGSSYATFLLGDVNSAQASVTNGTTFRSYSATGYMQDDWRASKNLTLNLGIRYDYQQQPVELKNNISNFDTTRTDPVNGFFGATVYAGTGGYGRNFASENYADFSPRIGFAYVLPWLKTTVLRGGYAMYYSSTANSSFAGSTNGFGLTTTTYSATTNNGVALKLENGFPSPPTQNLGAALGPAAFLGTGSVNVQEAHQPTPLAQVFTLTTSKQFPGALVVEVSYLGNRGIHFVEPNINLNQLNPIYFGLGGNSSQGSVDQLQQLVPNPYSGKIPGTLGAATITRANLLHPYPYYTAVADFQPHHGNYFGNFMYVTAQRRISTSASLIASYTFGKLISDPISVPLSTIGGTSTGPSNSFQNSYNRRSEHTVDTIDVTHRLTSSLSYHVPFGPGQRFLHTKNFAGNALSNITLNGILTMQSGLPLAFTGANNQAIANRPNFSGINPLAPVSSTIPIHTIQNWFNAAAFQNPNPYTFGNVPRTLSNVRGPGTVNLDTSLLKNFTFYKRYSGQFRLEAFNIFNHPNFSNPNTSFQASLNTPPANAPVGTPATPQPNNNGNFGKITTASSPRILQVAIKLMF